MFINLVNQFIHDILIITLNNLKKKMFIIQEDITFYV